MHTVCSSEYLLFLPCAVKTLSLSDGWVGDNVSIRRSSYALTLSPVLPHQKSCCVPKIPNFAYLNFAAYFSATGGGYDKLEVYKCSDGVKAPAVTREMVIRFPSCMVSWRHKEFHMVIQMLHLNLLLVSTPELSTSTELVPMLLSIWGSR